MTDFDPANDRVREIIVEAVRKCLSEQVGDTDDAAALSPLVLEVYKTFGFGQPVFIKFESPLKGCLAVAQINTLSEIHSITRDLSLEVTKQVLPLLYDVQPNFAFWESKVSEGKGWTPGRGVPLEPLSRHEIREINRSGNTARNDWQRENKLRDSVHLALSRELDINDNEADRWSDRRNRWFFVTNDIHELIYGQVANDVLPHIHQQVERPITNKVLLHKYARAIRQACRSAHQGALWEELPLRQAALSLGWSAPNLPYLKLCSKVGAFWTFKKVCIITSKPKAISLDSSGRLHNENGKAIVYPDGWGVYAWHGVRVPGYVVEEPGQITVRKINSEMNSEVRRVMMERYGFARYLQDSGAKLIDEQVDGLGHPIRLYRREVAGDEPLVMVQVTNSTAEPVVQADGTTSLEYKRYTLRVPPDMVNAREAIAWTFDMTADTYNPEKET